MKSERSQGFGSRPPRTLLVTLLAAALLLVYFPAIRGGFVWDDDSYVTENPSLRTADGLRQIWLDPRTNPQYYPLVHTSFWVEYRLWGLNPAGYHLVNVILHGVNALLLWLVLLRLGVPGAWVAACLFLLHPLQVESVAWITERKNVLSGFFYLASALAYLRFAGLPDREATDPGERPPEWGAFALSLLLFALALLSKTVTATLPAGLALAIWWKRGRFRSREVATLAAMLLLGAALGLHTAWLERHQVGASGPEWAFSPGERLLIAGRAIWFYLGKLLLPVQLTFIYRRWDIHGSPPWWYLFPLAFGLLLMALWTARSRLGRGPLTALLFYAVTLGPALGFLNVYPMRYSFVADHFQYLAGIGPLALIGAGHTLLASRFEAGSPARRTSTAAPLALLLVLGWLSWRQAGIYRNAETLWRDTIARNPGAHIARINLGNILFYRGRDEEAVRLYREILTRSPDHEEAHYNLANALALKGETGAAKSHYEAALRARPEYADAHVNLGVLLAGEGREEEALVHLREAARIDPRNAEAFADLGMILLSRGDREGAANAFRRALAVDPSYEKARILLEMAAGR